MIILKVKERNKLKNFIRAKHGNLKVASEKTKVSVTTLKLAYNGNQVSEQTYNLIVETLPSLN